MKISALRILTFAAAIVGLTRTDLMGEAEPQIGTAFSTVSQSYRTAETSDLAASRFRKVLADYQFTRCAEPKAFLDKLAKINAGGITITEWYSSKAYGDLTAAVVVHHGASHEAYFSLIVSPEKPDAPEVVWKTGTPIYQAAAKSLPPSEGSSGSRSR